MNDANGQILCRFTQAGDSINGDEQTLDVTLEDAGGGPYLRLQTNNWAIDPGDIPAFCKRLQLLVKTSEMLNPHHK